MPIGRAYSKLIKRDERDAYPVYTHEISTRFRKQGYRMFRAASGIWALLGGPFVILLAAAADTPGSRASDKRALAPAQAYVGEWKGVAQPKRGSNQGAWTEEAQWAWRFADGRAELVAQFTHDKYYSQLQLQAGDKPGQFVLLATSTGGDIETKPAPRRFVGAMSDGALVLTAEQAVDDEPARISLRLVAGGDRMLVLYERRVGGAYARLAEVGSTRKGSSFAQNVTTGPECVVTGGLGTIAVEHQGKKYYVCCIGCRDLFQDDPEGVLAEYRQRKAAERAGKTE
ncbi:MAG: hypothetical protein HY288_07870 [Planctomycetia bacterium]|nr:hypothetical protein [Planctomycetia bacterium]